MFPRERWLALRTSPGTGILLTNRDYQIGNAFYILSIRKLSSKLTGILFG